MSADELYGKTGIQHMDFNSIFPVVHFKTTEGLRVGTRQSSALYAGCAFLHLLTGKMVTEYTIASTSQLLNRKHAN